MTKTYFVLKAKQTEMFTVYMCQIRDFKVGKVNRLNCFNAWAQKNWNMNQCHHSRQICEKHLPNILYDTEIIINGSDTWLLVNVGNACDNNMGIS